MKDSKVINILKNQFQNKTQIDSAVIEFMESFDFYPLIDTSNFIKNEYTRVKLMCTNDIAVYCIYWANNSYSPPHDHPHGGCILKIIRGKLNETNYKIISNKIELQSKQTLVTDSVGIKYDDDLHSIKAMDNTISIHVYFPGDYTPTYFNE